MRPLLTVLFTMAAAPAMAHPLHIIESGGHNHWLALAALAAAAAAALLQAKKRGEQEPEAEEVDEETDAEPQEA